MKKALLYASMAFVALCVACNISELEISIPQEDSNTVPEGYKSVTVSATKDDAQSKTSYAGEQTFAWSDGDQISVWCTDASVPANTGFYTFTTSTGGSASATFTGTIPGTAVVGDVALYPANASHSYADGKYHFQVAGEKSYIGATQSADIPMYGVNGGSSNFSFTQMTGAVKFTVNNIPAGVTQVKFTFTAATSKLSGSFDVTTSSPYTWSTSSTETASEKAIVRYCPVTSNAFSVYVPYTEGTIWGDNTLLIQDYTGDSVGSTLYTQSNIGAIPVTRNKVTKLSTLSCEYRSAYGVDWSGISPSVNESLTYTALKTLKATMDPTYFYILAEVDPTPLDLSNIKAYYFKIYLGDESSGSTRYWGAAKSTRLDDAGWTVYNNALAFYNYGAAGYSSNISVLGSSAIYELRLSRSLSPILSQTENAVNLGIEIDDTEHNTSAYNHLNGGTPYGIIPTYGSSMYEVPQYVAPVSVAVTGAAAIDKTYRETITDTVNPERGMYRHNEYFFTGGSVNKTSVTCEDDMTLALTIFYLQDFIAADHISDAAKTNIRTILGNVRSAGKKAIVRFAYNNEHHNALKEEINPREPIDLAQIKNHIDDLASIFDDYKDIIYVFQAGFLGTYGEWYYTTTSGTPLFPMSINVEANAVTNYSNRAAVIDKLLAKVPSGIQIALRTPAYKCYYLHPDCVDGVGSWDAISAWTPADANHRLSFHNDAFLSGEYDMGTFRTSATTVDRTMWQSQGAWLAIGGETGFVHAEDVDPTYTALEPALQAMKDYRYSYLNDAHSNNEIVKYWVANDIYPIIRKRMGYRLVLNSAKVTGANWNSGTSLNFKLKIANTGSANVIYERPCKLVLIHDGTPTVLKDMASVYDIRGIQPDGSYTYDFDVTLPQTVYTGDKLAIWMPDKTAGLQGTAAYSIRLSNYDVEWDNGYNVIHTF